MGHGPPLKLTQGLGSQHALQPSDHLGGLNTPHAGVALHQAMVIAKAVVGAGLAGGRGHRAADVAAAG